MEQKRILIENSLHQSQQFIVNEYEDHIEISRLLTTELEKVEIPDIINGKPITVIGDNCFFNCRKLKEVIFPGKVESIGVQAFALCKSLTEVVLPNSILEIGNGAFRDCRGLKKVVLPKNLKRLPAGMFSFCHLRNPEIVLPEGLEVIESGAFWSAGGFDLILPDSVKEIGVGAFYWGPNPITKLPYNKGWFSEWPYGEKVIVDNSQGEITDLHYVEGNCRVYEVTTETEKKEFFFPCDYVDGNILFVDEECQRIAVDYINDTWESESELSDAYKIRNAWQRGFVEVR